MLCASRANLDANHEIRGAPGRVQRAKKWAGDTVPKLGRRRAAAKKGATDNGRITQLFPAEPSSEGRTQESGPLQRRAGMPAAADEFG